MMTRHATRSRSLTVGAVAFLLVACGSSSWAPREPSVDGWPLGMEDAGCGAPTTDGKPVADLIGLAKARLPDPHPVIADIRCYLLGPYVSDGQLLIVKSTGATFIVVVTFEDGTRKAIGLGCSTGGCGYSEPYRSRPGQVTLLPVSE